MNRGVRTFFLSAVIMLISCVLVFAGGSGEERKGEATKEYEIVYVAKLIGIPAFNTIEQGMEQAAKELGGVNAYMVGPAKPDAVQQARMVEDLIAKGVDAIIVMPNDTVMIDPILEKAQKKGILVLTSESMTQKSCDYDVELVDDKTWGEWYIKKLVEAKGDTGGYAVMVGGLTVLSHMTRMDFAVEYQKKNYPKLYQVTDRVPCGESVEQSHDKTLELIKAYPDLIGVISIGSLAPTGVANALKEKGLAGKIANLGATLPSQASPILKDGSMTACFLYSMIHAGRGPVYIAKWLLDGKKIEDFTKMPGVGDESVRREGKVIILDGQINITKENVDTWGF